MIKKYFIIILFFITGIFVIEAGSTPPGSNPQMSRVYGNQFTQGVVGSQAIAAVGSLDLTFGAAGFFNIHTIISGGQAVGIETLSNGNFFVVVEKVGVDSMVALYNAQGMLEPYGTAGVADLGSASVTPRATMLDAQGRLLVAGGATSGNAGWLSRIATNGTTILSFSTGVSWEYIAGLAQQSTGQTIAVGFNGNNAQIGRYNIDGTLDINFGAAGTGLIPFDGTHGTSISPYGLYGVIIDATNNIYVVMLDSSTPTSNAYCVKFSSNGAFVASYPVSILNGTTAGQYLLALNHDGNIVLAGTVGGVINVTAMTTAGLAVTGFTNFATSSLATHGTDTFILTDLITTSNGTNNYIILVGSDTTSKNMAVIKLAGTGLLDTAFNQLGYNFLNNGMSSLTAAQFQSAGVAVDGQLYFAGYEIASGISTPYVVRLNNAQYVFEVAQYPVAQEQGILDQTFGIGTARNYASSMILCNGIYGQLLKQQATAAIEITTGSVTHGDILIGMNGLLSTSPNSNMMLTWLTQQGAIDTTVGNNGYLNLANISSSHEYLTDIVQDGSGNIYVAGYTSATYGGTSNAAILRVYTSSSTMVSTVPWAVGTAAWAITPEIGSGWQGVGVTIQDNRTLLCVAESSTVGHISSYVAGVLDLSFGAAASGKIHATSYGLHMGPLYGLAIEGDGYIYATYVDSSTSQVNLVEFVPNGSGLVIEFGSAGIVSNIFPGISIAPQNVRLGLLANNNICVAATAGSSIYVAYINAITGALISSFSCPITGTASLNLTEVTGVSDGTVILTLWDYQATGDDTMYVARINSTGTQLDTTFNNQGLQQGVVSIKIGDQVVNYNARVVNSALVQSTSNANQGNIVVVGYESVTSSDATPLAMRVSGDSGTTEVLDYSLVDATPGKFETSYNVATSPNISGGSGNVMFVYPATNANNGKILIGIDNGSTSKIARVFASNLALDTTFGTGGIYTISGSLRGINHLAVDGHNNILVTGISSSLGWAQAINNAGTVATSCNLPTTVVAANSIYQQESGRYLVAGATATHGIVIAFQDQLVGTATKFAVDPTFNPLSVGSAPFAGSYYVGTTGLYAIAINQNDTIVLAYANTASPAQVVLEEITADGSGLVAGFNLGSVLTTGLITDNSAVIQLNIDSSGNIIIGASYNNTTTPLHQVQLQRYDQFGGVSTALFGTGVIAGVQTISNLGLTGVTLTDLMVTTSGQIVIVGYNASGGNGRLFAARCLFDGSLDTSFNTTPTVGTDTAGLLTYSASSAVVIHGGVIAVNGTILSIGSTSTTTSGNPIVTFVYGDNLVTQLSQSPLQVAAGILDTTIPTAASGALSLNSLPAGGAISGIPAKIYVYNNTVNASPNGAILIASADSANVYLSQLNADLSLNTNFGSSGVVTIAAPNITITDLYVANGTNDTAQPIYVVGYNASNAPWAAQLSVNGASSTIISPTCSLQSTGSIRQSSNSRVLISGYNGSSGTVVAYNSSMTAIDSSFGNNGGTGYYSTGIATGIYAMAIDSFDSLYLAYPTADGTVLNVVRLLANGTALDTTFNATFVLPTNSYSTTAKKQIRMAIDLTHNQLVVAAQDGMNTGNIIEVARFNLSNGSAAGTISTITIPGAKLNLADLFIDNNQNIYVIGYIATGSGVGNSIVARIVSQSSTVIALDTTYGVAGLANIAIGSMNVVTAGMLDPDRRIYLIGSGSGNGYMGRIFGDYYWTQLSPATLQAQVGVLDITLDPNFTGGLDISAQAGWSTLAGGYKVQAMIENINNDGTVYFAFGNGTNLIVGKANADMIPVTGFGGNGNGLTTAMTMATVNSITVDALGNIIVSGTNSSLQKVVSFSSVGSLNGTFANALSTGNLTIGKTVVQNKLGQYIVGGYSSMNSGTGIIAAFKNPSAMSGGSLPIDTTFGSATCIGYYPTLVATQVDDLCIDNNDYIYFVYRSTSNQVVFTKLTANGAAIVNSTNCSVGNFNNGVAMSTGITATQPACIAINSAGNILIGASTSSGVKVQLYNGSTGALIGSTVTVTSASSPILTKLVGSGTEFFGSIYTTTPNMIAFAINGSGVLDSNFGVSGLVTTDVKTATAVKTVGVQADGKVVMAGYNGTTSLDPIVIRVYGYPYVQQYLQAPNQAPAGSLDTTLWPPYGAYLLSNTASSIFNNLISGYVVKRMYQNSSTGIMTFVADSGNSTIVFQFMKDFSLNTSFNSTGYKQLTTSYGGTTGLFVDLNNNLYVTGNNGTSSWACGMNSTGTNLSPSFAPVAALNESFSIKKQTNGRVLLAGQGGTTTGQANTDGYLLGYTNSGMIDNSFGNNGQVDMSVSSPITDMVVDNYDNIITVTNNAGTVILQRATASGDNVVTLSGGTAITGVVGAIKVVRDTNGYIIVAAATATGYIVRSYNNNSIGTNNAVSAVTITVGTTPVLTSMYVTSDGKITLIGYDAASTGSTPGLAIVARLVSTTGQLSLDTTSFNATGTAPSSPGCLVTSCGAMNQILDGIIYPDSRIMLVGGNVTTGRSSTYQPYMSRVFGDNYVSYLSQCSAQGVAGTLNITFGNTTPTTGQYDCSTLNALLVGGQGQAILPVGDGGYYIALNAINGSANSALLRTIASGALDTSYNAAGTIPGIAGTGTAPVGVNSLLQDGLGRVLLVGTNTVGGWIKRYTQSGTVDASFGLTGTGTISLGTSTIANSVLEQTLGRLIVAGLNSSGYGALFAYSSLNPSQMYTGVVDTTFNAGTGGTFGTFATTMAAAIPVVIADSYDRLIFPIFNAGTNAVDLYRLTPTGELDNTFGSNGIVAGAISNAAGTGNICAAFDVLGNIVVAANSSTANTISVRAYTNGTVTSAGGNGISVYAQLNIASLTNSPSLTNLVTAADGYTSLVGTQSSAAAWIVRITETGHLDTTFNSAGLDSFGNPNGIAGIFQYAGSGTTAHVYNDIAVNANGTLGMIGYENSAGVDTPILVSVYNDPYTWQQAQSPDSKPVGYNDLTLGVSATSATNKGVIFYGVPGATANYGQVARSIGLYDDNNIVVTIDGAASSGGTSQIFIDMFDTDGLLNPNFGTAGQTTVMNMYQNQYVRDMKIFTTASGVQKAILAGYAYNSILNTTGSLLMQYILTPGSQNLDSSFGGFYGNLVGAAYGDGQALYSVAQQSTGRIIGAGLSQDNLGLLLGYTSTGKLDVSFGNSGYQVTNTGTTGIYTHVVDTNNRIIFAYNDGNNNVVVARFVPDGSGPDSSLATPTPLISGISGNNSMKVALDTMNNIYVAAANNSGNSIAVNCYSVAGGTATQSVAIAASSIAGTVSSVYSIGNLTVDRQGNILVIADDSVNHQIVVIRLKVSGSSFILDTTFNSIGYIVYAVAGGINSQLVTDAMIHPDGRILIVGSEN